MPKKMMPKSQANDKTLFLQYPFLTFFNSKKGIMQTNIQLLLFLHTLSIQ